MHVAHRARSVIACAAVALLAGLLLDAGPAAAAECTQDGCYEPEPTVQLQTQLSAFATGTRLSTAVTLRLLPDGPPIRVALVTELQI